MNMNMHYSLQFTASLALFRLVIQLLRTFQWWDETYENIIGNGRDTLPYESEISALSGVIETIIFTVELPAHVTD